MCLELRERVLYRQEVTTIVVFLKNLLVQAIPDAPLENIRVVMGVNFASRARRIGSMLAEKLDMLLRDVSGFIDMFRIFGCTPREFFGFVLDLGMKSA